MMYLSLLLSAADSVYLRRVPFHVLTTFVLLIRHFHYRHQYFVFCSPS